MPTSYPIHWSLTPMSFQFNKVTRLITTSGPLYMLFPCLICSPPRSCNNGFLHLTQDSSKASSSKRLSRTILSKVDLHLSHLPTQLHFIFFVALTFKNCLVRLLGCWVVVCLSHQNVLSSRADCTLFPFPEPKRECALNKYLLLNTIQIAD